MISFLKTTIYIPLYNMLVLLIDVLPGADVGLAIIILTLIVRIILYPLSKKSVLTQIKLKEHQEEFNKIKEKNKNQQEQAIALMEFYKKYNISPFSGFFIIIIQIPIIYSLYYIFASSGLPLINKDILYSFVAIPDLVSLKFLGLMNLADKNLFLAFLAGISSFFQVKFSNLNMQNVSNPGSFSESLSKAMALQMKYFLPVIVFFISWKISGAIALYWFIGNVAGIIQDLYIKKRFS